MPRQSLVPVIADIADRGRMEVVFKRYRPEIVIHAAAHKHVPLMEMHPGEAIRNNVGGTRVIAELADESKVDAFVLISTDKAVRPANVMGATKAMAEKIIHTVGSRSQTKFCAVRFGNVLGSAGSVVPTFQRQIRGGGPITITDRRMTRFFMSIPEASQLVLQAAAMSKGGEVFVLDMGNPLKIVDLAKDVIRLSGLPADGIDIQVIGMRPGEKLFEELQSDSEIRMETAHLKVNAIYQPPYSNENMMQMVSEILNGLEEAEPDQIRETLFSMLERIDADRVSSEKRGTRPVNACR
ncbi:Capsular polysaccharide biosynthesis protein capD [Rhodopirellula sallentina SM41]|uniref:Capsular polysaccharide biosynthesis protein capD n=1 Tax=Rhodopirellula sallentina SM41 TaxID=1263870 RepID=M5TYQ3_9BACT|nr:Capsular polysaccharide biosynthesis protein capD [Rhodopirellula sallentina SM41]